MSAPLGHGHAGRRCAPGRPTSDALTGDTGFLETEVPFWPAANAWLSGAYVRRDFAEGWRSLTRNTLAAHAEAYPDLWYGIWTGPDSSNGPDAARPGEADAHLATALTDYPALNAHVLTGPLRALMEVTGVERGPGGLPIGTRVPGGSSTVLWPAAR